MEFTLTKPPSVNQMYRHTNTGITYIAKKARLWFTSAGWDLKAQIAKQSHPALPIAGVISIKITFYYAGRWDYDNGLKAANDLLTKTGVIADDDLITEAYIKKIKVKCRKDEKMVMSISI